MLTFLLPYLAARSRAPANSYLVFEIGGDLFAFAVRQVLGVAPLDPPRRAQDPLPGTIGWTDFRGGAVPVVDMAECGRLMRRPGTCQVVIVLAIGQGMAGVLVDAVLGLVPARHTTLRNPWPELDGPRHPTLLGQLSWPVGAQQHDALLLDLDRRPG